MIWRKLVCSMTVVMLWLAPLSRPSQAGNQHASPQTVKILVYADDHYRSPNTFVDQALNILGKPFTAYHDNQAGFIYDLGHNSPWDLVIFAHEFYALDSQMYEALNKYASEGGRLIFQSFAVSSNPTVPLFQTLGFTYVGNDITSPDPVYWWKPGYPAFAYPLQVPEFTDLTIRPAYTIYGQFGQPRTGFQAWAGYSTPGPDRNQAALIVGNQNRTVFKGFMDAQNIGDQNGNGWLDGVELWINLINWILDPVSWGVLRGTVEGLGYCDSAPAVLPNATVVILPGAGGAFYFNTNAEGEYEWWTQETGLMYVEALHIKHNPGGATGIQVSLGMTTTLDFNLRLVMPCVWLSEHRVHRFLKPSESSTAQVRVENSGALIASWEVDERTGPFQPPSDITWVSESPITGTLPADLYQILDVTLEALPGMSAGLYTGYLVVSSNDPNAVALPITVTMVIGSDLLYLPVLQRNP